MKRLFINIVLFIVALILLFTIGVYGIFFHFLSSLIYFKKYSFIRYWTNLIYTINVSIDQLGNVLLSNFLNTHTLKNKSLFPFGNEDQTISYVLAVNYFQNNVNKFGLFIIYILEKIDKDHMKKSIN
jgi:hypothetical protein